MQTDLVLSWQGRRSKFSHDWLKNQFMPALGKFLNLLDDRIEDDEFERSFVGSVLPQWESHRAEARALALDFEWEMSPRRLFSEKPLCRSDEDTKEWLGELAHILWLGRCPVRRWINDATAQADRVDLAYSRLREALQDCPDSKSAAALRQFRDDFVELRMGCQGLAIAIEEFPAEVRVI